LHHGPAAAAAAAKGVAATKVIVGKFKVWSGRERLLLITK
jgi:hypothetical protein